MYWTYDDTTDTLYYSNQDGTEYDVYTPITEGPSMRSGQLYEKTKEREGPAPGSHYASVTSFGEIDANASQR